MSSAPAVANEPLQLRSLVQQFVFIALVLGIPLGLAAAPGAFRDGDVSWQVAAGQWILAHGRIPTVDPFSFTAAGHPWVATEWLAEIVYASAFALARYAGLATLVAAALMALNAIIFFFLQRRVSTLQLTAALLMMDVGIGPFVLARPHLLAWPLIAGWTILLLRAEETGRPPSLWWALLLVVWTNLHASFPLALPIAGAIGLDALIRTRWAHWREWLLFGFVNVVALTLNANGLAGVLQPFRISSLALLPFIGEWHPSTPQATPYFYAVLLGGFGALLWSGIRIPLGRLLLLLVLLALAFLHTRHQSTFVIVAACVVPPLWPRHPSTNQVPHWLLAAALPLLAVRLLVPMTPPESSANPWHLLRSIPAELRTQPVFNEYTFGGPLILSGIKPYIDGRAEMYGDDFVTEYMNIWSGDMQAFGRAVRRYGICWVILPRIENSKPLLEGLKSSGEWRVIRADRVGVVLVRIRAKAPPQPGSTASASG